MVPGPIGWVGKPSRLPTWKGAPASVESRAFLRPLAVGQGLRRRHRTQCRHRYPARVRDGAAALLGPRRRRRARDAAPRAPAHRHGLLPHRPPRAAGVLGAPLYAATGWSVAFTWYAAVIAATVMALPLLVRTARVAIESVDQNLERAAFTLGRAGWRTALEVTLPLARNGILAGLVLAFARALGEFGATLMLAGNIPGKTQTLPLSIYTAVQ